MKQILVALALALAVAAGAAADDKPAAGKGGAGKGGAGRGAKLARLFETADTNGDGKVSLDEFKKAVENSPKGKLKEHPEMVEKMFKRLDADGDGFVTKEELKKAMERMKERGAGKKPGEKKNDQ